MQQISHCVTMKASSLITFQIKLTSTHDYLYFIQKHTPANMQSRHRNDHRYLPGEKLNILTDH